MWARRVLLATMVAAAAMSLPRYAPATWAGSAGPTYLAASASR